MSKLPVTTVMSALGRRPMPSWDYKKQEYTFTLDGKPWYPPVPEPPKTLSRLELLTEQ